MMVNQLKIGTILSYIQMFLNVVVKLVLTPFLIRFLGQSEYGLYQAILSIISALSILSLGFDNGYIRFFSIYRKQNDKNSIHKLNGLYIVLFFLIGLIALLCGLFITFNLKYVFNTGLTKDEYKTAKILMLIMTVSLSVSFPMSVFQSIITAHERFVVLKSLSIIKTVISPLLVWPLLMAGYRSIVMVCVTVSVSLIIDLLYMLYVMYIMKEHFVFTKVEKGVFKNLFVYTFFISINFIIDQINWNIDKVLLGRYRGTGEVAVYSVGATLYQCYMAFSVSISGVFTPRIHRIVNETGDDRVIQRSILTDLFTKVGRIQFIVLGFIATAIVFLGKYFVTQIWADYSYTNAYYVALLLIIPTSIPLIQNLGIEIQRAENKHQFRSIVYAAMAILNLCLSIYLCQKYGAVGCTIGTAFSMVVANGIIMNIYYYKGCNIDIFFFWKSILRLSIGMIIPLSLGVLCSFLIVINSHTWFIIVSICYFFIYFVSMWFLGMNQFEKGLILNPILQIFGRKKA